MKKATVLSVRILALVAFFVWLPDILAYQEYGDIGVGGCDNCHGVYTGRGYHSARTWETTFLTSVIRKGFSMKREMPACLASCLSRSVP